VNNRLVLNGLLAQLGLEGKTSPLLRTLDKLGKIGVEKVVEEMQREADVTAVQAAEIIALVSTTGSNGDVLEQLDRRFADNEAARKGVKNLRDMVDVFRTAGVPDGRLRVDLSICRGLDYYTGTVYETFLLEKPEIGSVCSGGRYDNLAGSFTKQSLPGVGASLGLDRLIAAMEALDLLPKTATTSPVLVFQLEASRYGDYQRMARTLRAAGIGAEVYPEAKKIRHQFQYAERRGSRVALIAGGDEFDRGVWNVKNLATEEQTTVNEGDVVSTIQHLLV
jgi:histidyl-tRNA synthetase